MYKINNLNFKIKINKLISNTIKDISKYKLKKLILNKNVFINNKIASSSKEIIKYGEEVKILIKNKNNNFINKSKDIKLNILYEDDHLLIINKQSNLIVHPVNNNLDNTLLNGLLNYYPNINKISKFGIVHRLDKNTTGLMMVAKSEISFNNLKKLFISKKIIKEYDAILTGSIISGGLINLPISRSITNRQLMTVDLIKGKNSITHYRIVKKFNLHTHVKVRLETGRTHQIRVHMSYIKNPLVGDFKYSNNCSNFIKSLNYLNKKNIKFNRQALHSSKLIFDHPVYNKKLNFSLDLPEDMKYLLSNI